MKKLLLALFLVVTMLLVGCGEVSTTNSGETTDVNTQTEATAEEVIFNNDDVQVSYISINDTYSEDIGYSYLNLRIENKTDTEIWVTMPYCSVDNETVPFVMQGATAIYIKPGNTYLSTFGIQMFNLSIDRLSNAKEIEFTIKAVDKENIIDVIFEETMKIEFNK